MLRMVHRKHESRIKQRTGFESSHEPPLTPSFEWYESIDFQRKPGTDRDAEEVASILSPSLVNGSNRGENLGTTRYRHWASIETSMKRGRNRGPDISSEIKEFFARASAECLLSRQYL